MTRRLTVLLAAASLLLFASLLSPAASPAHDAPYCGHGTVKGKRNMVRFVTHWNVEYGGYVIHWHYYRHYKRSPSNPLWRHIHFTFKMCHNN